jgi:hypothetical protein
MSFLYVYILISLNVEGIIQYGRTPYETSGSFFVCFLASGHFCIF